MKTKRIIMSIELCLFLLGMGFAVYFGLFAPLETKVATLFSSIAIGLSTGGLVALLIEIPMYVSGRNYNQTLLYSNCLHSYIRIRQLVHNIDDILKHPEETIYEHFCEHLLQQLVEFATPLVSVDKYTYMCKAKQKQIQTICYEFNTFLMYKSGVDRNLKIKIIQQHKVNIQNHVTPENYVPAGLVSLELIETKTALVRYMEIINNTANLVYSKKQLSEWTSSLQSIENSLKNSSLYE